MGIDFLNLITWCVYIVDKWTEGSSWPAIKSIVNAKTITDYNLSLCVHLKWEDEEEEVVDGEWSDALVLHVLWMHILNGYNYGHFQLAPPANTKANPFSCVHSISTSFWWTTPSQSTTFTHSKSLIWLTKRNWGHPCCYFHYDSHYEYMNGHWSILCCCL